MPSDNSLPPLHTRPVDVPADRLAGILVAARARRRARVRRVTGVFLVAVALLAVLAGPRLAGLGHRGALAPASGASPSPSTRATTLGGTYVTPAGLPPPLPAGLAWGSNGILIPKVWGQRPLQTSSGTGWVVAADRLSSSQVRYLEGRGDPAALYTRQGNAEVPNLAGALRSIPKCTVTSHTVVADNAVLYDCVPQGGLAVTGAVVIRPYPDGFRWVEARLPALMAPMAQQIAGSLTTPPLVPGPYGFAVPKGWSVGPLRNSGGSGSFATVTDPQHRVKIGYVAEGGNSSVVNRDGSLNLKLALTTTGCPVSDEFVTVARLPKTPSLGGQSPPSSLPTTSSPLSAPPSPSAYPSPRQGPSSNLQVYIHPRGLMYQCQPTSKPGQLAGAMLVPENYWSVHWWKLVTVSGPPDQLALAVKVVESLHWSSP